MITATLINPQIYGDNEWYENTLILTDDNGEVVERVTVNFPWELPDAEVEVKIKQMACDKFIELQQLAGVEEPIPQEPQETLRWDWPEGKEWQ